MGLKQSHGTNPDIEQSGFCLILNATTRCLVARAGGNNKDFAKLLDAKMKPHRRLIDAGRLDEETSKQIMHEVYARTVVKAWETKVGDHWQSGIDAEDLNEEGGLLTASPENIIRVFRAYPDVFLDIQDQAGRLTNFQLASEIAEGN